MVGAGCGGETNGRRSRRRQRRRPRHPTPRQHSDSGSKATTQAPTDPDLSTWSLRQKLAQMLFTGTNARGQRHRPDEDQELIDAGAGEVFAGRRDSGLRIAGIHRCRRTAGGAVRGDRRRGGQVDLLASIIEPLPAAREMAAWDADRIREAGQSRGAKLAELGVTVDFAPVIDVAAGSNPLGDPPWSGRPGRGGYHRRGIRPGCAARAFCQPSSTSRDTAGRTPTATTRTGRDARAGFPRGDRRRGVYRMFEQMGDRSMLMTGHLDVPGLTDGGEPFSMNPRAMATARRSRLPGRDRDRRAGRDGGHHQAGHLRARLRSRRRWWPATTWRSTSATSIR